MEAKNPCGLRGIAFVEVSTPDPTLMDVQLRTFGFSRTRKHRALDVDHYHQRDIHFLINKAPGTFAERFRLAHGPSICAMGWRVEDAKMAFECAVRRGARPYVGGGTTFDTPAVHGIGDSLIYFVDDWDKHGGLLDRTFKAAPDAVIIPEKGFTAIDHLTNNVPKGTMKNWARFYERVFGFTEVRYFDIRGAKTGLTSFALRSPDGSFCIPINEGDDERSQIEEYLREYKGAGIQHLAFLTDDLLGSIDKLDPGVIEMLDIDPTYYDDVFDRVPNVREDHERIRAAQVLVDGDDQGYLLQIFTQNLLGPIFIELIQRHNHHSFGEGNFGALFRSIERDQERRGVI